MTPDQTTEVADTNPKIEVRIKRAYFWTIAGSLARYFSGFLISVALARLLKPEDYGLIGMVSVFVELLFCINDWGLGKAIVHFREDDPAAERPAYFTSALIVGTLGTGLLFASSRFIALFYGEPALVPLIRVMSFTLLIGSVKTVSGSILAREFRFRELSVGDIASTVVGGIVGIAMAFAGFGVWSLVANLLVFSVLQAVIYARFVRPSWCWPLDPTIVSRLWRYGAPTIGSSLLYKFYDNADYLVVGKVLGPAPLGFYTLAFRLAMLVNDRISAVINRVAFPSFANLKGEPEKAIEHWFAVTHRVTLITFPLLVWLSFNAKVFVELVLGTKWLPAVLPLRFLCVMTAVKILTNVVAQMMAAVGYPSVVFRNDLLTAIALPLAFFYGCSKGGLLGLGLAWCTVFPILRLHLLVGTWRKLHYSPIDYIKSLADATWVSLLCIGLMRLAASENSGWLLLSERTLLWLLSIGVAIGISPRLRQVIRESK